MKIISGGQTGVDQAALKAAKELGILTGGTAPKGWKTLTGPSPWLGTIYGLEEHPTRSDYPARTYKNVKDSDATLQIFEDPDSAGEVCTEKAVLYYKKPICKVDLRIPVDEGIVCSWFENHLIETLNVAGNSEKTSPGITDRATILMLNVFSTLLKRGIWK